MGFVRLELCWLMVRRHVQVGSERIEFQKANVSSGFARDEHLNNVSQALMGRRELIDGRMEGLQGSAR